MQRAWPDTWGMMLRHRYDEVGLPWRNTTVRSPEPASWYAIRLPVDGGVLLAERGGVERSGGVGHRGLLGGSPRSQVSASGESLATLRSDCYLCQPMVRPPKFDDDEILDRAMTASVWQGGWSQTSIRDLEEALDLKAPSIYRRFGSKEGLGAAVVDHYVERVVRRRVAKHLAG